MTRAILVLMVISLMACTTAVKRPNGTYDVPRQIEQRSAWGTNQSAMFIDNCKTKVERITWSNPLGLAEYEDCRAASKYTFASSPGQGGTILSGAMMAAGIGTGLALSGSTTTAVGGAASSSSSAVARRGGR